MLNSEALALFSGDAILLHNGHRHVKEAHVLTAALSHSLQEILLKELPALANTLVVTLLFCKSTFKIGCSNAEHTSRQNRSPCHNGQ